ncbi:hypothetical protein [Natrarchaeobaculum sulfurireducens]|uniref:Uncharacterized protein n=1 Tax=Natrarchaeobaculum sulfurireducens TaxID=2044521 RepID=A0A346PJK3_9EURY|nr:hypothetical protein [Natrarchaeobaculum sulfurireducens]AXR79698.1 hypothetical protein AArc1_3405 [Natrarchaeobaculum sulfurireducens]
MARPPRDADDLLVPADVLGSFGVTPADLRRTAGTDDALETVLADVLDDGQHPTAVLRRTIARSDRGLSCSARYPEVALEVELEAVFESIGWSVDLSHGSSPRRVGDRLVLEAADPQGRRREATITYPETPLGTDNLPAVLDGINTSLLTGTDAQFVLLSSGVDRWQAALVDGAELERLCERYGPRVHVDGTPLLPEHTLEAYGSESATTDADDGPWPSWAGARERPGNPSTTSDSLIEEAETEPKRAREDVERFIEEAETDDGNEAGSSDGSPGAETDGFELLGSPSVSRVADDESGTEATDEPPATRLEDDATRESTSDEDSSDGFGTLSGSASATRVSNESFGSDVEWEREDDRYLALGAALGAGGRVTVEGLLEDDDFLPELPAVEPDETRIAFDDPFDPAALSEAKAAAEQSGFVWVDSGALETTRVSNG